MSQHSVPERNDRCMLRKAGFSPGLPDSGAQRFAGFTRPSVMVRGKNAFTLIELLIVITVIAILSSLALPYLMESRREANETSALGTLKALNDVELVYRTRYGQYADLTTLSSATMVDPDLALGSKSGYLFAAQVVNGSQYYVTGVPQSPSSGVRYFYTDESATIFQSTTVTAPPTADTDGFPPAGFGAVGN